MRWAPPIVGLAILACTATRHNAVSHDSAGVMRLPTDRIEALGAALRQIADILPADTAPICVGLAKASAPEVYSPEPALLDRLRSSQRRVLPWNHCPPTYASPVVIVDSLGRPVPTGRPLGYFDPHKITARELVSTDTDSAAYRIEAWQGTSGWIYECHATQRSATWAARCRRVAGVVSSVPSNETLQLTSARSSEALRLSAWRDASARRPVGRILSRPLAAELRR
jgi:hypothetical protein